MFTQWHQTRTGGVQPLSFEIENVRGREWIRLRVWGGKADSPAKRAWRLAPLVRGKWYDFALRVRWAPDRNGLVQAWLNGKPVAFASQIPTLYYDESVYLKQGFYRQNSNLTSEVYIADTRRGASLEDIGITRQEAVPTVSVPRSTTAPTIKGVAKRGNALTATPGLWSNAPTRYHYQWQSSRDGSSWRNLAGANRSLVVLPSALSARAIRIRVTATNSAGEVVAVSAALGWSSVGVKAPDGPPADPNAIKQSIRAGQVLRGTVVWTVMPASGVKMIVFALDSNKVTHRDVKPPYDYVLDTTRLANGKHTFGLTVTRPDGTVVWKPYQVGTVTIDNAGR